MKRKVLCLFSFLLILLVFCTFLSPQAEEEMHTLVEAKHAEGSKIGRKRNVYIGSSAVTWVESKDVLYNIIEGSGWESGLRLAEIPPEYYDRYESRVEMGSGTDYWYVTTASRDPVAGGGVTVVEETQKGEDVYLLWHPDEIIGLEKLPNSMEVLSNTEKTALIAMRAGRFPFFEHRVWYTLQKYMGEEIRIYSIHDATEFLHCLPWIAGIAAVLIVCLLLWTACFLLPLRKGALWVNGFLIAGSLGSLPWLTTKFDLPASLLPKESILDVSHYLQTFERIFSSLEDLGSDMLQGSLSQAISTCTVVLSPVLLLAVFVIAAEALICRYLCKKKNKY